MGTGFLVGIGYLCSDWGRQAQGEKISYLTIAPTDGTQWRGLAREYNACFFFLCWLGSPCGPRPPHWGFRITFIHNTLGRIPPDRRSARRRDLCLSIHNNHKRTTCMLPEGFEPAIPASERPQTHPLDTAATGTSQPIIWGPSIQLVTIRCEFFHCTADTERNSFLWRFRPKRFLDHTQPRTTDDRTPLDEWSARLRDLYLHNTKQTLQTDIHVPGGIRTHNLSRRTSADLRPRPRGHSDRHSKGYTIQKVYPKCLSQFLTKYAWISESKCKEKEAWTYKRMVTTTGVKSPILC